MSTLSHIRILSIIILVMMLLAYTPTIPLSSASFKRSNLMPMQEYPIAVVGSDNADDIDNVLVNYGGYSSSEVVHFNKWSDLYANLSNGGLFRLVIINDWGEDPGSGDKVVSLLKALDLRDIPLLILDTGYIDNGGGEILKDYASDVASAGYPAPSDYTQNYPSPSSVLIDIINNSHPIFDGIPDPYQVATSDSSYCDYALYHSFQGPSVTQLAWLNDTSNNEAGIGIAEWVAPGGEHWIFHSSGGVSYWMKYTTSGSDGQYSSDHRNLLLNIVAYLIQTGNPHQPPKGILKGHVYDSETNEAIPDAEICAGSVCNMTDSTGYYELHLEQGNYTVSVKKPSYKPYTFNITITGGETTIRDIYLEKVPHAEIVVAVIGDYPDYEGKGEDLPLFLSYYYTTLYYPTLQEFLDHRDDYNWSVIVLNWFGYSDTAPTIDVFIDFLKWADMYNIPLVILDTWYLGYPAGYYMYTHRSDISSAGFAAPSDRYEGYTSTSSITVNISATSHPIFVNLTSDYYRISDYTDSYYAYYTSFTSNVSILANISINGEDKGIAIAEWKAKQNESWIFISYATNIKHHYNISGSYGFFTSEAKQVLLNAILYAASTHKPPVYVRIHGYVKEPDGTPIENAMIEVSNGPVNYTDANGYYVVKVIADYDYNLTYSKIGYYMNRTSIHVGYSNVEINVTLVPKPPSIVIVGDHDTGSGKKDLNLTLSPWWNIQEVRDYKELWDVVRYEGNILLVIFNKWSEGYSTPPSSDIVYTLQLLDENNISAIFLAGYGGGYYGVYPLYNAATDVEAAGYPAPDNYDYWYSVKGDKVWYNETNPDLVFFKNIAPDTDNAFHIHRDLAGYAPYRGFNFTDETVKVYAWFTDKDHNQVWMGLVNWNTSDGDKWVFLIGASTDYVRYTEAGDENQYNLKMLVLLNNTINYILGLTPPTLTGKLVGQVTDKEGNPVPNAKVEIVELGLVNYTDSNGNYVFSNVFAGTYTLKVSKFGYYDNVSFVSIGYGVTVHNVVLKEAPPSAIIVGKDADDIVNAIKNNYPGMPVYWAKDYAEMLSLVCSYPNKVGVVVIDDWGVEPSSSEVLRTFKILDAYNIPLVLLDSYGSYYYHGAYYLYEYKDEVKAAGYPAVITRTTYWDYNISISMNASTHPVFNGITPDFDNAFYVGADTGEYTDYAALEFDPDSGVVVLGDLLRDGSRVGGAVFEWSSHGGEKWIILSSAASYYWMKYNQPGGDNQYSAKMLKLLVNSIIYANSTREPTPTHVVINITVFDSVTLNPLENAEIKVNETGTTYYTGADGRVVLDLPIICTNYHITIRKPGYVARQIVVEGYINRSITILLNQYGNSTITGTVYDAVSGEPIPGAIVEVPGVNSTITGPNGEYSLKIPAGRWNLTIRAPKHLEKTIEVAAPANQTVTINVYLERMPAAIAVVGDIQYSSGENDLTDFLKSKGFNVIRFKTWLDLYVNLSWYNISLVILDNWGSEPSAENVTAFLRLLDENNIPLIILDTWDGYYNVGGYYLYEYKDEVAAAGYPAPAERIQHYPSASNVFVEALYPEHPLFNDISYDFNNSFYIAARRGSYEYVDYAAYTFRPMKNLSILAALIDTGNNINMTAVAVWIAPGGERWIFVSYGSSYWVGYNHTGYDNDFTDAAKQLLLNAINYALTTRGVLNGTLEITVKDELSGEPISGAAITIKELGVTTATDSGGNALLNLYPGIWTILVNKSGYFNASRIIVVVEGLTSHVTILLAPTASLEIHVVDEKTGAPVKDAVVSIEGIGNYTTGSDGRVVVGLVPAGTLNITIKHPLYYTTIFLVSIEPHKLNNITLRIKKLPPIVIILGDSEDHDLEKYVKSLGYYVEVYDNLSAIIDRINTGVPVRVVILNYINDIPDQTVFDNFIQLVDEKNISLIILDSYAYYTATGGYIFYHYRNDLLSMGYAAPSTREIGYKGIYGDNSVAKYRLVTPIYNFTYDLNYKEAPLVASDAGYANYAYYEFPSSVLIDEVAKLIVNGEDLGTIVAVWYAPGGEKWIFMGAWSTYWNRYVTGNGDGPFSVKAKDLLARAIFYAGIHKPRIDVLNVTIVGMGKILSTGTEFRISGYAYIRSGNERIPLANSTIAVYALSKPVLLGTLPTDENGFFNGTITVPAISKGELHSIGIGDPANQYEPTIVTPQGYKVWVLPAPEPPITPIVLLAIILLFILLKKRK